MIVESWYVCKAPTALGEHQFFLIQSFTCRPKVTIPIKQQILGQARRLERGQQMTIQILAAETITEILAADGHVYMEIFHPKNSGAHSALHFSCYYLHTT